MKKLIKDFNKNPNKKEYKLILESNFTDIKYCKKCNDVIFYYDSKFKLKNDILSLEGKHFNTKKIMFETEYYLSYCEECVLFIFDKAKKLNKAKWFNTSNEISSFAFNIPKNIIDKKNQNLAVTLENLILKHGEKEGSIKWNNYIEKHRYKNTYEGKKEKYGWTKDQFDNFNKTRSVTLEHLILKHGDYQGTLKWEGYLQKQRLTKSKEYVIKKYGIEYWNELNAKKTHDYNNYMRLYKEHDIAIKKLEDFYSTFQKNNKKGVSKSSQKYLYNLNKELELLNYNTYYFSKNDKEYGKKLSNGRWVWLDFYIKDLNINVEYNGDLYHANPKIYNENDIPLPFIGLTAKKIWENDKNKLTYLKTDYDIDTIVIWESELPTIEELILKIKEYEYKRIKPNRVD